MGSIYDLDPKVRKLLSLDNFLDNLTVYEFIEELGKEHSVKSQSADLKHFDPKPFIRTFESTLRELKQLTTDAAVRRSHLEKEVNKYELDHSRNMLSLTTRAESVNVEFKKLDNKISIVSSLINPITENLATTINAKERSVATIGLIQIYEDFYKTNHSRELESLVKGPIDKKKKCASTVAQLLSLSQKLISDDLSKSQNCHDLIQEFSSAMESSLLEEFDREFKANNLIKMKEIADILTDYNGGIGVINNFVSQHNFFANSESFSGDGEDLNDEATWDKLSDPDNHHSLSESFSSHYYNRIAENIKDESVTIVEVFRDPVPVLMKFIQRIFAQQVQSRIEALLKNAYSSSNLAYLRTLCSLYIATGSFTKSLNTFFQSTLGSENHKLDELSSVLEQSYSDLFSQHLSDSKYLDLEKKSLESIFSTITSGYERSNEGKISNKLATRLANLSNENLNAYEQLNKKKRFVQLRSYVKHRLDRTGSLKRSASKESFEEPTERELSSHIDLHYVDSLLKSTVESLSRQIELIPNKTAEFAYDLLEILLLGIGKSYVDLGLEVSYNELHRQDYRNDRLDFEYLHNVNTASEILYLVSTCIRTILLPLANNNPQVRQKLINLTNSYISRVELAINVLVKDTLSLAFDKVQNSLGKQKKKDYMATDLSETDTPACMTLCNFLHDFHIQVKKFLNGQNLDRLLRELGNYVFNQLFEHYKNFQINSTGGIVVTKDIISYQNAIEEWKNQELSNKFLLLREIANLFTVQPDLLNSLTKEGKLATIKPYILRQFLSKRSDYNTNKNYLEKLRGII